MGVYILIAVFVVVLILAISFIAIAGHIVVKKSKQMTKAQSSDIIPLDVFEKWNFDYEHYKRDFLIERIEIMSTHGDRVIPAKYIYAKGYENNRNNKTVVMVHGLGGNKNRVFPMSQVFLEAGYNVLTYDQRSAGENIAKYTTFGYLEKYDLIDCVELVKTFVGDKQIGVWGMSFGGSTVCCALTANDFSDKISFIILDCPIDSMRVMVGRQIDRENIPIPTPFMLFCGNIMNKLEMHFKYSDVISSNNIKGIDIPLLVINSQTDQVTPYSMGKAIYDASPSSIKDIVTFEDCHHADGYIQNCDEYKTAVKKLLDRI